MQQKEIIAMILAGGRGSRLQGLTRKTSKPAVHFGGGYRLIDFCLSNCYHSGLEVVGVLTQYEPQKLHKYIGNGRPWYLDRNKDGIYILPPYINSQGNKKWYQATANAIYQNIEFIDSYNPENILILSADHIYKMDYNKMLEYHKSKGADATISVIQVPWEETHHFGILNVEENNLIKDFIEKPDNSSSNLASMGIYIFNWKTLKKYLIKDNQNSSSSHDFGKNIIPGMLENNIKLFAYKFDSYWKDVGTINNLWKANMDILSKDNQLNLSSNKWPIYSRYNRPFQHSKISQARVENSLISSNSQLCGQIKNSIIGQGSYIGEDCQITNSIIMPEVKIKRQVKINRAIIGRGAVIESGVSIEGERGDEIKLVEEDSLVKKQKERAYF